MLFIQNTRQIERQQWKYKYRKIVDILLIKRYNTIENLKAFMDLRQNNKRAVKLLNISRFLTPENQVELSTWVHLAYFAENSARKSLGSGLAADGNYPEGNLSDYLVAAEKQQVPAPPDKK
jgi:hypothetical protein